MIPSINKDYNFFFVDDLTIVKESWNFIGVSVDGPNEKVTLYVNDGFSPFLEENVSISRPT